MRTVPYIRLLLTIAILVAVAPLCATAVTCNSCVEFGSFADEHEVPGEVVKRPVLVASTATAYTLMYPARSLSRTTAMRDIRREAPPAPAARLRV